MTILLIISSGILAVIVYTIIAKQRKKKGDMEYSDKVKSVMQNLITEENYLYYLQYINHNQKVWIMQKEGEPLIIKKNEQDLFPVWPEAMIAQMCVGEMWPGYKPESINLEVFMTDLLPRLKSDNINIVVNLSTETDGLVKTTDELQNNIMNSNNKVS